MLRRIFGLTTVEVTGGGRKRHNEGLHNLYFSSDVISEVELGGPDGVQKHDTLWGEKNEG